MKKLMIAAAIVCAAACANADASYSWYISNRFPIAAADGHGVYGGPMTVTCAALSYSRAVTASNGSFELMENIVSNPDVQYALTLTAETATHTYLASATGVFDGLAQFDALFGTGKWTEKSGPKPTPEPTSGLLMLLGMAGLALKRKRA